MPIQKCALFKKHLDHGIMLVLFFDINVKMPLMSPKEFPNHITTRKAHTYYYRLWPGS